MDLWGRLSNPVQRRLPNHDVDQLVDSYTSGSSIDALARRYGVHRTTVIGHLDRSSIPRRRTPRKLTDAAVVDAAHHYKGGLSLEAVARVFEVDAKTLAREFRQAGVLIRHRRGWA